MERLVPACDNVVADGMVVFTNSAQGARGAPHKPAPHPLTARYDRARTASRSGNCTLAAARERLQHARRRTIPKKLRHEAVDYSTPLIRENDKCVQVHALHPGVRKRAEREDLGPSRHRLAHDRWTRRTTAAFRIRTARYCGQSHHPLPHGGAARARRHGPRLRRDRRSERRHRGAGRARGARGMGRAVRPRPASSPRPSAWSRRCSELGFNYVFDTDFAADLTIMEEGSEFIERFTHKDQLPVADVHVLLPGLGALCEVPVSRTDGQSLHGQVAPADVRCGGEELLCRKGRYRPQAPFRRLDHAVRVEKERMRAADDEKRRGRPRCRREHHDARAEHHDPREPHRPRSICPRRSSTARSAPRPARRSSSARPAA